MAAPTLLIVDDEETILFNLISFFEDEGYTVHGVNSGEEGLEILEKYRTDIALVDMRLPGMDGNSFIKKAQKLYPYLQFLIHTGSTDYSMPKVLTELGMSKDQVLFKPVLNVQLFLDKVEKYFDRQEK